MILILNTVMGMAKLSVATVQAEGASSASLSALPDGGHARVVDVAAENDDAIRLKSLGICVGRRVQAVKAGDPLIVRVMGARVGLSARLASTVIVEPLRD